MKNNNCKPKEFAELINISARTLQRWDIEGKLKAFRTPTDRRYYTYEQYLEYKGIHKEQVNRKKCYLYKSFNF
ncbi:MerR family regulatory protein [Clostridioides difficile]|nr:MerR family regulatory protein [Clostridioides difficile]SJP17908.1 MerR family regulatory protein [Clostridioides difficile]SJS13252.1 MerR family regulatory protein [Clostridioides difficile]